MEISVVISNEVFLEEFQLLFYKGSTLKIRPKNERSCVIRWRIKKEGKTSQKKKSLQLKKIIPMEWNDLRELIKSKMT